MPTKPESTKIGLCLLSLKVARTEKWVDEKNIDRYFDKFCFRINHSQSKQIIFHNLIKSIVENRDYIT